MIWLWRFLGLRRVLAVFVVRKAWGMYRESQQRAR